MQAGAHYDQHANSYDSDLFGIFQLARQTSIAQLDQLPAKTPAILDIGCGTGKLIEALGQKFAAQEMIGLDPSKGMLELARARGATRTVCASALEAEQSVAPGSIDLACLHFVLAYVDPRAVFQVIARLLKPHGKLSLVTSTMESQKAIQEIGTQFVPVEEHRRLVSVPADEASLRGLLGECGFRVLEVAPLRRELVFANPEELYQYCVRQGWLAQFAEHFEWARANPELASGFFPIHDEFRGLALLAERTG